MPRNDPIADEASFYQEDDHDTLEYWQIIEILNLSEEDHNEARLTRSNRERLTWTRLITAGANLPPLQPDRPGDRRPLFMEDLDLLFTELDRRGALNIKRLESVREIDSPLSNRELFDILRHYGYVWRPRMLWNGGCITPSGWSTSSVGDRRYMISIDAEAFRDAVLDYRRPRQS